MEDTVYKLSVAMRVFRRSKRCVSHIVIGIVIVGLMKLMLHQSVFSNDGSTRGREQFEHRDNSFDIFGSLTTNGQIINGLITNTAIDDLSTNQPTQRQDKDDLRRLGNLVQRRLHYLQNPGNCSAARKLVCNLRYFVGFGSILHQVVACLGDAYASNRTLILEKNGWNYDPEGWQAMFRPLSDTCTTYDNKSVTKWLGNGNDIIEIAKVVKMNHFTSYSKFRYPYNIIPMAIPDDLADTLLRHRCDAHAWWVGQLITYLTRPNNYVRDYLEAREAENKFRHPIVGLHVRRTDKIGKEASFIAFDVYMQHVSKWFDNYEQSNTLPERVVFLATDERELYKEAREKYPNYTFISTTSQPKGSPRKTRYSRESLRDLLTDIEFLTRCDYVVCTFTSNICRLVYEKMQTLHDDAVEKLKSLDIGQYFFHYHRVGTAIVNYTSTNINMRIGDELTLIHQFNRKEAEGFSIAVNSLTKQKGPIPLKTVRLKIERVVMPTYTDVLRIQR